MSEIRNVILPYRKGSNRFSMQVYFRTLGLAAIPAATLFAISCYILPRFSASLAATLGNIEPPR